MAEGGVGGGYLLKEGLKVLTQKVPYFMPSSLSSLSSLYEVLLEPSGTLSSLYKVLLEPSGTLWNLLELWNSVKA